MASSTGYTLGPIQYEQATGKPFAMGTDGNKHYLSPRVVNPYGPAGNEGSGGLITPTSVWNDKTGKFDKQGTLEKITLAAALAPFAAAAVGGIAGAGGGSAAGAGTMPALSAPASVLPAGGTGIIGGAGAAGTTAGVAGATMPALSAPASVLPAGGATGTLGAGTASTVGQLGVPASLSNVGLDAVAPAVKPALNGWADLLKTGGQMLTNGAQQSANQDASNNNNAANWLRAMDEDYKTKLGASVDVPAGLQKQALWSDYIQNAKTSNPDATPTNLLTPGQQDMVASQKAVILKKLADANAMPLPTAPVTPTYQQPGAGTNIASTLGTVGQIASQVPWSKVLSYL